MSQLARNPAQGLQLQQRPNNTRALPYVKLALILTSALGHAIASPISPRGDAIFSPAAHHGKEPREPRTGLQLAMDLTSIGGLVLLGGVFAGLTLALMGLDELHLQVLSSSGTALERRRASKVLRLPDEWGVKPLCPRATKSRHETGPSCSRGR